MSKRLYEHKRSSLELSESDSEDYNDYRGESSAQKNEYTESYGSQNHPYSPESNYLEISGKPNPKSILKENSISASKSKRNIVINETLNETHRIAQKNESGKTSPEKHSLDESDKRYRDYIREDKLASGGSYISGSPEKDYTDEDDEGYESKLTSKYSQDDYDRAYTGFKNRLVVGQEPTDFQKAHAKKMQQELEQTYSSKGLKDSADKIRERWLLEKGNKESELGHLEDSKRTGQLEEDYGVSNKGYFERDERNKGYESLGLTDKKESYESRHSDPASKFERMEDKISFVEKELDNYSKSLVRSTLKQEEQTQSLNKVCEDFEYRLQDLKDEFDRSLSGKNKASGEYKVEGKPRRGKTPEIGSKADKSGVLAKSSKLRKSSERVGKKKGSSSTFKKLQEEVERLKELNGLLKEQVAEKEQRDKERTIKASAYIDTDLSREKEIIDTIERIKKKLRKAITKKMHKERENEVAKTMNEPAVKELGRNYTSYGLHYKDVLKHKVLEDKTSAKENAHLLHKGLPTTYKDYESPMFAEKLTKTTKR